MDVWRIVGTLIAVACAGLCGFSFVDALRTGTFTPNRLAVRHRSEDPLGFGCAVVAFAMMTLFFLYIAGEGLGWWAMVEQR
ncbi:hypothetical protein [Sphingomonas humi]|uniref:Uncharacterized protein n=1 Tax=Sphingomonas humi TaxID=335630 RepID=A0ABP7RT63_9SPHN